MDPIPQTPEGQIPNYSDPSTDRRGISYGDAKQIASEVSWRNIVKCLVGLGVLAGVLEYAYQGDKGHLETLIKQQNSVLTDKLETLHIQNSTMIGKLNKMELTQAIADVKINTLALAVAENQKKIDSLEKQQINRNSIIGAE